MDHFRQKVEQILLRQFALVVLGADLLRHHARVRQLALVRSVLGVIPDAERPHRHAVAFREQPRVGAGVDPAGQKHADRNVAHLAQPHRGPQLGDDTLGDLAFGQPLQRLDVVPRIVVPPLLNLTVG